MRTCTLLSVCHAVPPNEEQRHQQDLLLGALLSRSQCRDTLLRAALHFGEVAHHLGERQQLLAQYQSAELGPP
jgi:hypothetical protein